MNFRLKLFLTFTNKDDIISIIRMNPFNQKNFYNVDYVYSSNNYKIRNLLTPPDYIFILYPYSNTQKPPRNFYNIHLNQFLLLLAELSR